MKARVIATVAVVIAWPLLTAASCATTSEPAIRTVEVRVPIRQPCVPEDLPKPPAVYADENSAHMTPEERYLAIARANQERRARLTRLEPVVELCR